jgi:hypothetical protein
MRLLRTSCSRRWPRPPSQPSLLERCPGRMAFAFALFSEGTKTRQHTASLCVCGSTFADCPRHDVVNFLPHGKATRAGRGDRCKFFSKKKKTRRTPLPVNVFINFVCQIVDSGTRSFPSFENFGAVQTGCLHDGRMARTYQLAARAITPSLWWHAI